MRRPMVAGNWKMNGRREMAAELASRVAAEAPGDIDVLLCPPFPYLAVVGERIAAGRTALGAQNLAEQTDGAVTGEVSGEMLRDLGCTRVLVGHSERRALFGESSALVARKYLRAREAGLSPILCVGETLAEREQERTEQVLEEQLAALLEQASVETLRDGIIAYEPVWAIGTGHSATPEQAQAVHAWLRQRLASVDEALAAEMRLLYGGSVNPDNAASLFAQADIDGGLIGGASLEADRFLAICKAATAQAQ